MDWRGGGEAQLNKVHVHRSVSYRPTPHLATERKVAWNTVAVPIILLVLVGGGAAGFGAHELITNCKIVDRWSAIGCTTGGGAALLLAMIIFGWKWHARKRFSEERQALLSNEATRHIFASEAEVIRTQPMPEPNMNSFDGQSDFA